MSFANQEHYSVRCEWGLNGVTTLAAISDVIIIIDVLSFSTSVDIAVGRGAWIYPYRYRDESARVYAAEWGAQVAARQRDGSGYSLSPSSLLTISAGTKLVLPSPNGATLSLATGEKPTFAACLRNAAAVAQAAVAVGGTIGVIPAGERWRDGGLRPSVEDWLGAGAVIDALPAAMIRSPEAMMAQASFQQFRDKLPMMVEGCSSGRELVESGFAEDVRLASALNVSSAAPRLIDSAYHL